MSLRLGIDTGGTYTDAVLVDGETLSVLEKSKSLTTRQNLIDGIAESIGKTIGQTTDQKDGNTSSKYKPEDISLVCLSTTLATNSIVEGHGAKAALVLMGYRQSQLALAHLDEAARDMPVIMIDGCLLYTSPSPRDRG